MAYTYIVIGGREYRYSAERHNSGRPASMQFCNARGVWRNVRNMDRSDQLFDIADGRIAA